jgi:4-amino-4-deoxy-L-arabinose transferase-like glycosyltransferase
MIPFVRNDHLWKSGLAGAIPAGFCMTLAAVFLFAAVRREFASVTAASAATAVFLLNPNTLYVGSIPMTEPVFFASLFALVYFTGRFAATQGWGALLGAAIAACAGTLTRYEGWLLLPFAALVILIRGPRKYWLKRCLAALVFSVIAGAGPLFWLAHNRWYFGDPLYFYRGPYSALAIQRNLAYPGKGDWRAAIQYYLEAGRLVAGLPGMLVGGAGLLTALMRRNWWPALLLSLPPAFYVWSIHSSATPIFVPTLWPHSWYNTRYAMAFLPLIAIGIAAFARMSKQVAAVAVMIALAPFLLQPMKYFTEHSITWQESDINSRARRQWTARAARYLSAAADPHDTFLTSFNDLTGIFRAAGIPLRDTLTSNNDVEWAEATTRPDLFLHEDWAVVSGGDIAQGVIDRARLHGPRYDLEQRIMVRGAPVIEIYHRVSEN